MCAQLKVLNFETPRHKVVTWTRRVGSIVEIRHGYSRGTLLEIQRVDVSSFWYGVWSAEE
jgi:hypothetical protein